MTKSNTPLAAPAPVPHQDLTRPTAADKAKVRFAAICDARGLAAALVDGFPYSGPILADGELPSALALDSLYKAEERHGLYTGESALAAHNVHPTHCTDAYLVALAGHLNHQDVWVTPRSRRVQSFEERMTAMADVRVTTADELRAHVLATASAATTPALLAECAEQVDAEQRAISLALGIALRNKALESALRSVRDRCRDAIFTANDEASARIFKMLLATALEEVGDV